MIPSPMMPTIGWGRVLLIQMECYSIQMVMNRRTRRRRVPRGRKTVSRRFIRRKNLLLDQAKIDRARRLFNAATETEAIHRALDAAADLEAFQRELDHGFNALVGAGGFVDVFDR